MGTTYQTIDALVPAIVWLGKILPVFFAVFYAFLFLSTEKLPEYVTSRPFFYFPIVTLVYAITAIGTYSTVEYIFGLFVDNRDSDASIAQTTSLPPIEIPPLESFSESRVTNGDNNQDLTISGARLGMDLSQAVEVVLESFDNCQEYEVEDRAYRGISVTKHRIDPVFQSPRILECFTSADQFEHFYFFPDTYETSSHLLALVRVSVFDGLGVDDLVELLSKKFGQPLEPSYQPNFGKSLYWTEDGSNELPSNHSKCAIYLPRALRSSLTRMPIAGRPSALRRAQLSSAELKEGCNLRLHAFVSSNESRIWLMLADSNKLLAYKQHGLDLETARKTQDLNKARTQIRY